jgi:hypothetical protein
MKRLLPLLKVVLASISVLIYTLAIVSIQIYQPMSFLRYQVDMKRTASVVIYYIIGAAQILQGKDLRGMTWERDIKNDSEIIVEHCSTGYSRVNGIKWTSLPEGAEPYFEVLMRRVTKLSWEHFVKHHPNARWFLRGFHDMWVNITNLRDMVRRLDEHYDPMTQWVGRYGCGHQSIDYPHGSTGHFFSNFAVRELAKHVKIYDACDRTLWDDLCVRLTMEKLGYEFYSGCSTQFIISYPRGGQKWSVAPNCSRLAFYDARSLLKIPPTPLYDAVTVHMHSIPMEFWNVLLLEANHMSVIWEKRGYFVRPFFCKPVIPPYRLPKI